MLRLQVLDQLVFAVVALRADVALVGFVVCVTALVVVLVADRGEGPRTELALVWLLASVNAHVHEQVSALVEIFLAPHALEEAVVAARLRNHVFKVCGLRARSLGGGTMQTLLEGFEGVRFADEEAVLRHVTRDQVELFLRRDRAVVKIDFNVAVDDGAEREVVVTAKVRRVVGAVLRLFVATRRLGER